MKNKLNDLPKVLREAKQFSSSAPSNKAVELAKPLHFSESAHFTPLSSSQNQATGASEDRHTLLDDYSEQAYSDEELNPLNLFKQSRLGGLKKLLLVGLILFTTAGIAQLISNVIHDWQTQNWLNILFDIGLIAVASSGVFAILSEIRKLSHLKHQLSRQLIAKALIEKDSYHGEGLTFCLSIAQESGFASSKTIVHSPSIKYFLSKVDSTHSDAETLKLYDQYVLKPLDKKALALIQRDMTESGLLVAISPLAIIDMLFVAWRNIRLVNKIAEIYGIEMSYWARIRLLRQVLVNVAFVGGTELLAELGGDVLSQDLLSRFSARAAQGIGAGFLTARLGLQTMQVCRPIPFLNDKPRLKDLRKNLLKKLSLLSKS